MNDVSYLYPFFIVNIDCDVRFLTELINFR